MKITDEEIYAVMQGNPYAEDLTVAIYEFLRYEYENNIFDRKDKRTVEKAIKRFFDEYLEKGEKDFFY